MRKNLRPEDPLSCCFHACRSKSKKLQTPLLYGTHLKSAHFTATSRCILSCLRYRRSASNFSNVLVILSINTSCSYCNLDCRIDCSISYVKKLVKILKFPGQPVLTYFPARGTSWTIPALAFDWPVSRACRRLPVFLRSLPNIILAHVLIVCHFHLFSKTFSCSFC